MQDFRKLLVWHKALALAVDVYSTSESFPNCEKFNLIDQLKRAAASVPANIAEACARRSSIDFCRFLRNSLGSLNEVDSHLVLAGKAGILRDDHRQRLIPLIEEVRRMLTSLIKTAQSRRD